MRPLVKKRKEKQWYYQFEKKGKKPNSMISIQLKISFSYHQLIEEKSSLSQCFLENSITQFFD